VSVAQIYIRADSQLNEATTTKGINGADEKYTIAGGFDFNQV